MFSSKERGTFKYWFAHWCAYQMTALNLRCWKPRFLLHDVDKPWLNLIFPYPKSKILHRKWSRHHLEYSGKKEIDWLGMVIDWECSRFTKIERSANARQVLKRYKNDPEIVEKISNILKYLGL